MREDKSHGTYKEFRVTSFAVDHPTSVMVLMLVLVFVGFRSYLTIPKESMPEITVPNIIVNTVYAGVSPGDIETLITRPLEEELHGIADVEDITSSSIEGFSSIKLEFAADVDIIEALQLVREKVDLAKPELPPTADDPQILEINFADFPIMQVNVAGPYDQVRLREVAEDLQDELELIPGVLEVDLAGGLEREVFVDVDLARLQFYGVSFDDVIDAIRAENVTIPGGSIDVGNTKYLVRVPGEFQDVGAVADVVVLTRRGHPIYVRDVATVDFGFKERDSYARLNGNPVVTLSVRKRSGQNIIKTAEAVRATIARLEPHFPPGTEVEITSDESNDIRNMVSNLENNIISALILVVVVLLFFLGVRTASFVGVAIPLSMLLSFSVMNIIGFSLNMVVLFSLILALGMLVDNGIVVVENIYRFREYGYDRASAAKYATAEVAWPIIASTATTLAAFFPMVFWPGIVGEFMSYLPLTLIITLSSSLFVALIITPTLCALFLETEEFVGAGLTRASKGLLAGVGVFAILFGLTQNIMTTVLLAGAGLMIYGLHRFVLHPLGHRFMTIALPGILQTYKVMLTWALNHRKTIVSGSFATLVAVLMLFGRFNAGVEYFPEDIPPQTVYVQVEGPIGTRIEQTDSIVRRVEELLVDIEGRRDFKSVVSTVGRSISGGFDGGGQGTHVATVAVNFVDFEDRSSDAFETLELMREIMTASIAGADISVEKPQDGPGGGLPVVLEIIGEDVDYLKILGDQVVQLLERSAVFARLDGLESDLASGRPELIVEVDRERAGLYGLSTRDIGMTIRNAINGAEASEFRDGENEYDITVRLAEEWRSNLSAMDRLTVFGEDDIPIPLSSVASWYVGEGFGGINRRNMDRVVTVSSDVRAGFNSNAVLAEVMEELSDFDETLPPGYQMRFAGQQEDQQESQAFLMGAFFGALILIAFILISQFDSVTKPLIIMTSVLLSTVGVLIGLMVFRMPFGIIMTGIGVISLAGIVVNNAIVLIDYIDVLRYRDGRTRFEALIQGGVTRFRPVVLTAITTVLGLVPLAIGLNFDFFGLFTSLNPEFYWGGVQAAWWGPMAIAVIAGLTFATFLTLILVPVLYAMFDDFDQFLRRVFLGVDGSAEDEPVAGQVDGPGFEDSAEPVTV